jgi:glycosyltransferase involved in cell wall biosynthesis
MMQPEIVSIMMPAYNAQRYICQAIESALAQTYPFWVLLVVDDGSTDQTSSIIAGYADTRIKIYHQSHGGEAAARNTALQHMTGEYLAFLDADDLYLPEHLKAAVDYLRSHAEYDGVYSDGYYIDENGRKLKTLSSRRRGPFEGDIFDQMVRDSDVLGAPLCVVLRKAFILRHHLEFDPDIVIGPDWDFFTRFAEIGRFGSIRQPTCLYRIHQANISIKIGIQERKPHLARCREKAIKLKRFGDCSLATRSFVFYDLLVNLLTGNPERQTEITRWTQFEDLPQSERARLYRLMASEALFRDEVYPSIGEWLQLSYRLNPSELTGTVLYELYHVSPQLCKLFVKLKRLFRKTPLDTSPFSDLLKPDEQLPQWSSGE